MMPNYGTPPIEIARGDGVRVWDTDGREYLDFVGRDRGLLPRARSPGGRGGRQPSSHDAGAHLEPGDPRARRSAGRAASRAGRRARTGVLRQQRRRGQRVRHQARPQTRLDPQSGRHPAGDRRRERQLPRPDAWRPRCHRQSGQAGALRAPSRTGLVRGLRRRPRARGCGKRANRRGLPRARPWAKEASSQRRPDIWLRPATSAMRLERSW